MHNEDMIFIIIAGMALVIVGLGFYMFLKDKETTRKIKALEEVIEKTTNDLYKFQKSLKDYQATRMENNADNGINKFYKEIKEVHELIKSDRSYFEEKILKIENRVRDFGHLGEGSDVDEKRIIALYQEGWSVDSIAKELRIGRGEVEFTLKLADI